MTAPNDPAEARRRRKEIIQAQRAAEDADSSRRKRSASAVTAEPDMASVTTGDIINTDATTDTATLPAVSAPAAGAGAEEPVTSQVATSTIAPDVSAAASAPSESTDVPKALETPIAAVAAMPAADNATDRDASEPANDETAGQKSDENASSRPPKKRKQAQAMEDSEASDNDEQDGAPGTLCRTGPKKTQVRYDPETPMSKDQLAAWRREARRVRNRESAAASRQRIRDRISELEDEADDWKRKYTEAMDRLQNLERVVSTSENGSAEISAVAAAPAAATAPNPDSKQDSYQV